MNQAASASSWLDRLIAGWRGYALIALIALAGALPGVASLPVLDRDEARFAQASRQMIETGDYVRIRVQDTDRNKKPIGIHWLQAGATLAAQPAAHSLNAIWTYRIPSVLGVVLAALATFWAGQALIGRRAAFLGAALLAGSMMLGVEGMIAKTDGALAGVTTLAMAALAWLYAKPGGENQRGLALCFWITFGIGVLIKGPITPMVSGLTILALGLWTRDWRWLKPLARPLGPILAVLIVAPWMIAIGLATHGQFFVEAIGGDLAPKMAGGQEGHFAWPGTHLLLLPALIFPAALALPAAARLGWRAACKPDSENAAALRFLLAWAVPTFLAFELLPTKLAHYTLPAYPAIALLCGAGLVAAAKERWRWTMALGVALFALAGALLIALTAYAVTLMPGDAAADARRATQAGLLGGVLFLGCLAGLALWRAPLARTALALIAALSISWSLRERILPEARTVLISAELSRALHRADLSPNDDRALWVYGYRETSLAFMTRTDIRMPGTLDVSQIAPGDTVIVDAEEREEIANRLAARDLAFTPIGSDVRGRNYGNGSNVDLAIGVATPISAGPIDRASTPDASPNAAPADGQ